MIAGTQIRRASLIGDSSRQSALHGTPSKSMKNVCFKSMQHAGKARAVAMMAAASTARKTERVQLGNSGVCTISPEDQDLKGVLCLEHD